MKSNTMAISLNQSQPQEPFFSWSSEFSVGIEEIDEQHKALVDLINALHKGIIEGKGINSTIDVMNRLIEYTRVHFALEECLMRILDYPGYEAHKIQHEDLICEIEKMAGKVRSGQHVSFELLHFLINWFATHMIEEDKTYAPFLLSKGVVSRYKKPSLLNRIFHR